MNKHKGPSSQNLLCQLEEAFQKIDEIHDRLPLMQGTVETQLDVIRKELHKIMAAVDTLRQSVADLGSSISAELAAISAKLSSLPATGTSDADVQSVVDQINTLKNTVDTETAALSSPATP